MKEEGDFTLTYALHDIGAESFMSLLLKQESRRPWDSRLRGNDSIMRIWVDGSTCSHHAF